MAPHRQFPPEAHGQRQARFALVGEAPGARSLAHGRQWTGPGGLILRREIRRLGLDLEDVFYLTNAVKCWPSRGQGNRSPLRSEVARCQPYLQAELAALDPEVVVAVGAVAARAVGVTDVRLPADHGRRVRVDGREVIVLLHPANASRHRALWPAYRSSLLALFAELAARAGWPVVEVAAAVIRRDGRYLLTQRGPGRHLAGFWEFPGGKRRSGESLQDCLRRELQEELGVRARVGRPLAVVPWRYPGRQVVLHFYRCSIGRQAVVAREGQAVRWASARTLARLRLPPADAALRDTLTRVAPRPAGRRVARAPRPKEEA